MAIIKSKLKKRLLIISLIIGYSLIYTFMIALMLAQSLDTIYYHFSSGILIGILGCLTLYLVSSIDRLIDRLIVKTSKYVFILSFFISFFASIFMFALIGWVLNVILRDIWIIDFAYVREQLVIINYLAILILSYYTISYFSKSTELHNKKLRAENNEMSKALHKYASRVSSISNKKTILIDVDNINYFQIEGGVVFAYTDDNKKHPITTTTLNELESKLNPAIFFRINRSEIIHIDKIKYFEPYFKDRLAIKFNNSTDTLYTSNKKAALFREWLSQTT